MVRLTTLELRHGGRLPRSDLLHVRGPRGQSDWFAFRNFVFRICDEIMELKVCVVGHNTAGRFAQNNPFIDVLLPAGWLGYLWPEDVNVSLSSGPVTRDQLLTPCPVWSSALSSPGTPRRPRSHSPGCRCRGSQSPPCPGPLPRSPRPLPPLGP